MIAKSKTIVNGASILEKLDLRDRVQVMAYAIKRGIVQSDDLI